MNTSTIVADRLITFSEAVLSAVGLPAADAHLVADSLVRADLWGHQSHGVMRLSWYVAHIRAGVVPAVTQPELIVDAGAGPRIRKQRSSMHPKTAKQPRSFLLRNGSPPCIPTYRTGER